TTWTASVGVSKEGTVPLFASLYSGKGLVVGLQDFTSPSSYVDWIRPAISNAFYTNGFNTGFYINGLTAYERPATNIQFTLQFGESLGNLNTQQHFPIQAGKTGQFTISNNPGNRLKLVLTPTTGVLNGTWLDATNGLWT